MDLHQRYKQIKEESAEIAREAIEINVKIKTAKENLQNMKADAIEKYGTDSIEELQRLLEKMIKDNEEIVEKAERELQQRKQEVLDTKDKIQKIQQGIL